MILTSYFGNISNLPEGKRAVSIALHPPKGIDVEEGSEFYPTSDILRGYKAGVISTHEYEKQYRDEVLAKLDAREMYAKYDGAVLLCYEAPNDFCHRQIMIDWFKENGFNIEELRPKISIAVVGSRGYNDYETFSLLMDKLISNYPADSVRLVSGGATSGADQLAVQYANEVGLHLSQYLPDWTQGNGAGYARNVTIWNYADIGIAFWDGRSSGTAHSFEIAARQRKKLYVVHTAERHRVDLRDHTLTAVKHGLF